MLLIAVGVPRSGFWRDLFPVFLGHVESEIPPLVGLAQSLIPQYLEQIN